MIPRWQAEGYWVKLLFLRVSTPEITISRVRQRVLEGGHDVPEDVVRRRFHAGWRNFETIYRDLVDEYEIHNVEAASPCLNKKNTK
jgi:predicted ABC-type ATPase